MFQPKISIIVPSNKGSDKIKDLLDGLEMQDYPKDNIELIIIDDDKPDGLEEKLNSIKSGYSFKIDYKRIEHKGVSTSRNDGILRSSGDYILFLSIDTCPINKDFLNEHMSVHNKDHDAACLGPFEWHPKIKKTPLMDFIQNRIYQLDSLLDPKRDNFTLFMTYNISLNRKWLKDDMFNEELTYGYEDTELGCRLCEKGLKIIYNKNAHVYHNHEFTLESFMQRQIVMGQALKKVSMIQKAFVWRCRKKMILGLLSTLALPLLGLFSKESNLYFQLISWAYCSKGIMSS